LVEVVTEMESCVFARHVTGGSERPTHDHVVLAVEAGGGKVIVERMHL
jgi:hypothetical protein